MTNYHLHLHVDGYWILKRYGAKRALFTTKNWLYPTDFDAVFSATMTNAKKMQALYVHDAGGGIVEHLDRKFISLFED